MKNNFFCKITDDGEEAPLTKKQMLKKMAKAEKYRKDNAIAHTVATKFLEENININFEVFIDNIKANILSSTDSAEKLGISPKAFFRLKKKYNIEPIYTAHNKPNSLVQMSYIKNKCATKNFYSNAQLALIPQSEIELVQLRSARSLSFPQGLNVAVKWERRGRHSNGKLKARNEVLSKFNIYTHYDSKIDKYEVRSKEGLQVLTKKEVDKLNLQYSKMKAFV